MSSSDKRARLLTDGLTICLCLFLAYAAGFGVYWVRGEAAGHSEPIDVFWEAWDRVEKHLYGDVPSAEERTYGAIRGALSLLEDPYTVFVEPQPRELERDRLRGSFGGIGVTVWRNAEGQVALSPYPDSPARQAGVLEGDVLLAVDNEALTLETTIDDVKAHLHGNVGTPITLTLSRPPTPPFDLTITRSEIQVPSITWRVLDRAPQVGYIHVQAFTERTADELLGALDELRAAAVTSLVLDLRDNSGGLLDPAVAVASQFLRDGVVLYEQSRDAEEREFPVRDGGTAPDIPLVVLVNGGTASAAEIVAGALQDHERAPLIGEATFGKGSVQLIYELSDGSSLHVTSAIWLTPNGQRIEGHGLMPDVEVLRADDPQDNQLEQAVAYVQSQVQSSDY